MLVRVTHGQGSKRLGVWDPKGSEGRLETVGGQGVADRVGKGHEGIWGLDGHRSRYLGTMGLEVVAILVKDRLWGGGSWRNWGCHRAREVHVKPGPWKGRRIWVGSQCLLLQWQKLLHKPVGEFRTPLHCIRPRAGDVLYWIR